MLYSNKIVFSGHPDKVCDQISDSIIYEYIKQDKNNRCEINVLGSKDLIVVAGEVKSNTIIDIDSVVNKVLKNIGYNNNFKITNKIEVQIL